MRTQRKLNTAFRSQTARDFHQDPQAWRHVEGPYHLHREDGRLVSMNFGKPVLFVCHTHTPRGQLILESIEQEAHKGRMKRMGYAKNGGERKGGVFEHAA